MSEPVVRRAGAADLEALAQMRVALWPDGPFEEHRAELEAWLATGMTGTLPSTNFVAEVDGTLVGFLQVGLRSHAESCDPLRPVGYVEGWFVRDGFRGRGIGRELLRAAEEWSRRQRCREMASDALIDNTASQQVHTACGFEEVERSVHYRKSLVE